MEEIKLIDIKGLFFLCNYKNGAVIYIDENTKPYIQRYVDDGGLYTELPIEIQDYMNECGFCEYEEPMKQAYLHVTNECNMNCIGCYSKDEFRNKNRDISLQKIKRIIDVLYQKKYGRLIISGGEPLLRDDLLEIVKYAKKNNMMVSLISNGSIALSDELMCLLSTIDFSIDFLENDYNTLNRKIVADTLKANIALAKRHKVPVAGIITLNSQNISYVSEYFDLSMQMELPISFSIYYSGDKKGRKFNNSNEQLINLVDTIGGAANVVYGLKTFDDISCRSRCAAGYENISVDFQGNLNPCHMMGEIKLGNILDDKENVWERLEAYNNKYTIPEECQKCDYMIWCGGGCKARTIKTGKGIIKDRYCEMYKRFYELQFEYIKKVIST